MHRVAVAQPGLVVLGVLVLEAFLRRRDLGDPRVVLHRRHRIRERFERRQPAAYDAEIDRHRGAGLSFRSEVVSGPGGRQVLLADPAGNLIELFEPARQR